MQTLVFMCKTSVLEIINMVCSVSTKCFSKYLCYTSSFYCDLFWLSVIFFWGYNLYTNQGFGWVVSWMLLDLAYHITFHFNSSEGTWISCMKTEQNCIWLSLTIDHHFPWQALVLWTYQFYYYLFINSKVFFHSKFPYPLKGRSFGSDWE